MAYFVGFLVVAFLQLSLSQFAGRTSSNGLLFAYEFREAQLTNPTVVTQPQAFDSVALNILGPLNISPAPKATELAGSVGVKCHNAGGSTTETVVSSLTAAALLAHNLHNFTMELWIPVRLVACNLC